MLEKNTNFESLIKNLENHRELYDLTEKIILDGIRIEYSVDNSIIQLGVLYGIFRNAPGVKIDNRIYEQRIYNYMSLNLKIKSLLERRIDDYSLRSGLMWS
ncbi:MAG: hypothetical protein GY754_17405 [bacterium]|nr:hypothetical protein [bacterium]